MVVNGVSKMILSDVWSQVDEGFYTEISEIRYKNGIFRLPTGTEFDSVASFLKKCTPEHTDEELTCWTYMEDGQMFIVFND